MLVGLQGVGKTTTAAKLAKRLGAEKSSTVALASLDVRRPAAMEQLAQLAAQVEAPFIDLDAGEDPVDLAESALNTARLEQHQLLILDTAGRARVDDELLEELTAIAAKTQPAEVLLAIDCMAGQDALAAASAFAKAVQITGVVLTKADGDARGGAALSIADTLGLPVKLIGTGEKLDALDAFHPDRMVSRILGMGDLAGLVEQAGKAGDTAEAERVARKIGKGKGFDLQDMRGQLAQMMQMGGLGQLLEHMPLPGNVNASDVAGKIDDKMLKRQLAIIDSMTPLERRQPRILDGSRKRRVANGSGVAVQDVNRLLKQFGQMQKMMKKARRGGKLGGLFRPGGMPGT
jgi:signal recognition particle subunit SRP54